MDFKYVFYSQQNQRVTGTSRKVRILFITIYLSFLLVHLAYCGYTPVKGTKTEAGINIRFNDEFEDDGHVESDYDEDEF